MQRKDLLNENRIIIQEFLGGREIGQFVAEIENVADDDEDGNCPSEFGRHNENCYFNLIPRKLFFSFFTLWQFGRVTRHGNFIGNR